MLVDHQQFFDAMRVQDRFGFLERGADADGDQVLLGHHVRDGQVVARLEAQVAIGENAHQLAVLGHRNAGDAVALHDVERVGDLLLGIDGDRIDDHAAFRALHAVHFLGLPVDRHVAVDDADAALLRERDGQVRFGDGIHGGADHGNIQSDLAREPGARVGVGGHDAAARGQQQDVVKSESFRDRFGDHARLS